MINIMLFMHLQTVFFSPFFFDLCGMKGFMHQFEGRPKCFTSLMMCHTSMSFSRLTTRYMTVFVVKQCLFQVDIYEEFNVNVIGCCYVGFSGFSLWWYVISKFTSICGTSRSVSEACERFNLEFTVFFIFCASPDINDIIY